MAERLNRFRIAAFVALLLASAGWLAAEVTVRIEPPSPQPGETVEFHVTFPEAPDADRFEIGIPSGQARQLLTMGRGTIDGTTGVQRAHVVAWGDLTIGPITIHEFKGEDRTGVVHEAEAIGISVAEPPVAAGDPEDYTALALPPINWGRTILLATAAVLLLTLLGWMLLRLAQRLRRRPAQVAVPGPPPVPPLEEARGALARLADLAVFRAHGCKAHYSELSEVVRRYLERQFDAPVLEMTEDEATDFAVQKLPSEASLALRMLFANSSVAKFARWEGTEEVAAQDVARAEAFLNAEEQRLAAEEYQRSQQRQTAAAGDRGEAA